MFNYKMVNLKSIINLISSKIHKCITQPVLN